MTLKAPPSSIKFSQGSIAMCFQNGDELNQTCEKIAKGTISVSAIPTIRILEFDGKWYR